MGNKPADRKIAEAIQERTKFHGYYQTRSKIAETPKMHIYVNGKHAIDVDENVAHDVARTYMLQGDSVWLTRKTVTLTDTDTRKHGKR